MLRLLAGFWPQLAIWKQFYMHSLKPNVWVKLSKVHQNFQVIAGKQGNETSLQSTGQFVFTQQSWRNEQWTLSQCNKCFRSPWQNLCHLSPWNCSKGSLQWTLCIWKCLKFILRLPFPSRAGDTERSVGGVTELLEPRTIQERLYGKNGGFLPQNPFLCTHQNPIFWNTGRGNAMLAALRQGEDSFLSLLYVLEAQVGTLLAERGQGENSLFASHLNDLLIAIRREWMPFRHQVSGPSHHME